MDDQVAEQFLEAIPSAASEISDAPFDQLAEQLVKASAVQTVAYAPQAGPYLGDLLQDERNVPAATNASAAFSDQGDLVDIDFQTFGDNQKALRDSQNKR
jgi:hypothetical protein